MYFHIIFLTKMNNFITSEKEQRWNFVNPSMLDMLWRVYHTDVALSACRNVICNKMLSLGVMFQQNNMLPSRDFYTHVQRHIVPFSKNCIDCLYVQGFCVFTIDTDNCLPVVLNHHLGRFGYRYTKFGSMEYGFIPFNADEPLANVFFVRRDDVSPQGFITSAVSVYYRSRIFLDSIERNAIVVDTFLANPPIYTETNARSTFGDEDLLELGAADDPVRGSLHAERLKRQSYTTHMHDMQNSLSKMLNAHHIDTGDSDFQRRIDPVTGLPNFDKESSRETQPIIPLPYESRAVNVPAPRSRADLIAIRQDTVEHACLVMGVPASFLRQTSSTHVASVNSALTMLDSTLNQLRSTLTYVLEDLYRLIYNSTGEDDINIIFPGMERPEIFKDLYSTGVLTYEAYVAFLQRYYHLNARDFVNIDMNSFASEGVFDPLKCQKTNETTLPGHAHEEGRQREFTESLNDKRKAQDGNGHEHAHTAQEAHMSLNNQMEGGALDPMQRG